MSDEEDLNFASENFDPIKALYSENVQPPNPSVPVMDNLSKFELTPEGELITKKIASIKVKVPEDTESSKVVSKVQESQSNQPSTSSAGPSTTGEKKEEKQPEETQGGKMTFVKRKKLKNVLTRMENMTKGPLSKLKFCMDQRRRVKIVTRTGHGVRGTLEGFVEAFDKQWNVALRDVHEVWAASKTNKAKAPPAVEGKELSPSDAAFRREMFGIKVPKVSYVNSTKKRVTLERHIDQLLVRGEQIVLIIV